MQKGEIIKVSDQLYAERVDHMVVLTKRGRDESEAMLILTDKEAAALAKLIQF